MAILESEYIETVKSLQTRLDGLENENKILRASLKGLKAAQREKPVPDKKEIGILSFLEVD